MLKQWWPWYTSWTDNNHAVMQLYISYSIELCSYISVTVLSYAVIYKFYVSFWYILYRVLYAISHTESHTDSSHTESRIHLSRTGSHCIILVTTICDTYRYIPGSLSVTQYKGATIIIMQAEIDQLLSVILYEMIIILLSEFCRYYDIRNIYIRKIDSESRTIIRPTWLYLTDP